MVDDPPRRRRPRRRRRRRRRRRGTAHAAAASGRLPLPLLPLFLLLLLARPSLPLTFEAGNARVSADAFEVEFFSSEKKVDYDFSRMRDLVVTAGNDGEYLEIEFHDGAGRMLRFDFGTNDAEPANSDVKVDADTFGWFVSRVTAYDDASDDKIVFDVVERMMADDMPTQVRVRNADRHAFKCDYLRYDLYDGNTRIARFIADGDVTIGAYMDDDTDVDADADMDDWDPCDEAGRNGPTEARNGIVYCNSNELDPTENQGIGDLSDGRCVDSREVGVGKVYFHADNMAGEIDGADDYTFCVSDSYLDDASDGGKVSYNWDEGGLDRKVEFRAERSNGGWRIIAFEMLDDGGTPMDWRAADESSSSKRTKILQDLQVPSGYDIFECEEVEIEVDGGGGTFKADKVRIAAYLDPDYDRDDRNSYNVFNPCDAWAGSPSGSTCSLRLPPGSDSLDGGIRCVAGSTEKYLPAIGERSGDPPPPSGTVVEWKGAESYVRFTDPSGTIDGKDDYDFGEALGECPNLRSSEDLLECQWDDDGKGRMLYFRSSRIDPDRTVSLTKVMMKDDGGSSKAWCNGNYVTSGSCDSSGHNQYYPMARIPRGNSGSNVYYDAFHCDEVEFTVVTDVYGDEMTFSAKDFTMAFELNSGYNPNNFATFEPCPGGQTCRYIDNGLMCGRSGMAWEDVYHGVTTASVGTTFSDEEEAEDGIAPEPAAADGSGASAWSLASGVVRASVLSLLLLPAGAAALA